MTVKLRQINKSDPMLPKCRRAEYSNPKLGGNPTQNPKGEGAKIFKARIVSYPKLDHNCFLIK